MNPAQQRRRDARERSGLRRPTEQPDEAQRAQLRAEVLAAGTDARELSRVVARHAALRGSAGALAVVDQLNADLHGLGPLEPLLEDSRITDILVNSPQEVWIDNGDGLQRTALDLGTEAAVRALATRLIAAGGRRLDDSSPCVDVTLGRFRVHAVIPPLTSEHTFISVRVAHRVRHTLEGLVKQGMCDQEVAGLLRAMVRERLNFLVSGATGTGKTTLLGALLELSAPDERIVIIEDATELEPQHPHVVNIQSRRANIEGTGAVSLAELVRQALRMRPDRLIVGEMRGAEIEDLLAALNTGHQGGGASVHANSAQAVPARLAALASLSHLNMASLVLQAASAIDVLIHIRRDGGHRYIEEIALLEEAGGKLVVAPVVRADRPAGLGAVPTYRRFEAARRLEARLGLAAKEGD